MSVTVTPITESDWTPPRVRLDVTADADAAVRIVRIDPRSATPVRGTDEPYALVAGQTVTLYDYEVPFGMPVRYLATDAEGKSTASTKVTVNPVNFYPNDVGFTTTRGAVWLRHLTIPKLSMPVDLSNAESPTFKQARSVVDVLNRRSPIVVSDARRKRLTTTLDIRTWSLEESAQLREMLSDNSVLLLDVPDGERWGITHWYIAVGDVTEERLWQEWAPFEGRVFHLPVEMVDRPTGGTVYPECCYWSEQRNKATYFDLNEAHPTYAQMTVCAVPGGGGVVTDPRTWQQLAYYAESDKAGTYGTTSTQTTPGGWNVINMNNRSDTYNHVALPFQAVASPAFAMTAGAKYKIVGSAGYLRADTAGSFGFEYRVTPGTSATTSSGTVVGYGSTKTCGAGDLIRKDTDAADPAHDAQGYFMFDGAINGAAVISYNYTGTVTSISTATDFNAQSGAQINIFERVDQTTTTTTAATVITLRTTVNLVAGAQYRVRGYQLIQASNTPITAYLLLIPGDVQPDPNVNVIDNVPPGGQILSSANSTMVVDLLAEPDGAPFPVMVETDGVYTVALRLEGAAAELFSDRTDADNPRYLQVLEYR